MSDAEKIFLAGIYPNQIDRLLKVSATIPPEILTDPHLRWLYHFAVFFLDKYGGVPNPETVRLQVSHDFDAGEGAKVWVTFASICGTPVSDADFYYAAEVLSTAAERRMTGEALGIAFEIFDSGYTIGTETLQGHRAAQEYLASRLPEIRRQGIGEAAEEADVRSEAQAVYNEYYQRKTEGEIPGIAFGIPSIDKGTGGMYRGDLILAAAFTSMGKSQFCVSVGWHAAVMQGKNVFFSTSETTRADIRNRFIARHSRLPQFEFPEGLDSNKIRRATLSPHEETVFKNVLEDLHYNSAYGMFHIAQVPRGSTLSYLELRMLQKHRQWNIDLAINDYLNLLKPDRGRSTQREEASDILKDAKVLATSFGGVGVPFMSPWQISRAAYQKAQVQQFYDMDALSEASEAEKSADLIFGMWHNTILDPRRTSLQTMKSRNAAPIKKVDCDVDYRNAYFSEVGASPSASNLQVATAGWEPPSVLAAASQL